LTSIDDLANLTQVTNLWVYVLCEKAHLIYVMWLFFGHFVFDTVEPQSIDNNR